MRTNRSMSPIQAWKIAARPHTLPAAAVPVLAAGGLARADGVFRWDAFLWALLGGLAIQVAANFANDASDARRGADTAERTGPPRMVALGVISPTAMWMAAWLAVAVAGVAALALSRIAGPVVLVVGVVSVLAMLGYVGGPAPYGYRGLGEVFVFIFFGLVATVVSRYVHDASAPLSAWLVAVPIGLLAAAILVVNNLRDRHTDEAAGKRTLAVLLGDRTTRRLFAWLVFGSIGLVAAFGLLGVIPRRSILALAAAVPAAITVRAVAKGASGRELIDALRRTARVHLIVGLGIALGSVISL